LNKIFSLQQCYAGNTAAAFVQADSALRSNPSALAGQAFFIPDDTPVQNSFQFIQPFLQTRGMQLSRYALPYPLVYGFLYTLEMVLKALAPLVRINLSNASCSVQYINMDLYFRSTKARDLFGFKPVYMPEEAMRLSMGYYKSLKLE
jgi:3beta-hydroxy-delta5-steroid dehydrogenase / steroid delta-isomerase